MSKYTIQLRFPIEQRLNDLGLENQEANWHNTYELLGLNDYPLFDELYRNTLNHKIIRRFYFREIGFETLAHFRWMMRRTMHEIMPYYNQLYESEKLVTEPMRDFHEYGKTTYDDVTDKFTYDGEKTTDVRNFVDTSTYTPRATVETTDTNYNRNVFEDTPMSLLSNTDNTDWYEPNITGDGEPEIGGINYATNVTYDSGGNKTTTKGVSGEDVTQTDRGGSGEQTKSGGHDNVKSGDILEEKYGFRTTQAEILMKYRKTFLNIDMEILDRLDDLFLQLW